MALEVEMLEPENALADVESTVVEDADAAGTIALRKAALADLDKVNAGIAALVKQYGGKTFEVTTTSGMDAAKEARVAIRTPRYRVEHIRKAKKAELREIGSAIEKEAERITGELLAIEEPIDAQIKVETDRKAAEKAQREQEAREQQAEIDNAIAEITNKVVEVAGKSADEIAEALAWIDSTEITLEDFGDSAGRAMQAKAGTQERLEEMLEAARAREADQAKLSAERAEMDAERAAMAAERAELEALKAEKLAAAEAKAQEERDKLAEQERQEQAKRNRAQSVQIRIDAITSVVAWHTQKDSDSATIQSVINSLSQTEINEAFFEGRVEEAVQARDVAVRGLATLMNEVEAREADALEALLEAQRKRDAAAARIRADSRVRDMAPQMLAGLEMVSQDAAFSGLSIVTRDCVTAMLAAAKAAAQ